MKMPSGEHKGKEISFLPTPYLRWVSENWEDDEIREYAADELSFRKDEAPLF